MATAILIVDDRTEILDYVGNALSEQNYRILKAFNFYEAIGKLQDNTIDLMISDINMPGESGFELADYARKMSEYRDLPIIMLSGESTKANVRKANQMGVDAFLSKSVDVTKLIDTVARVLKRKAILRSKAEAEEGERIDFSTMPLLIVEGDSPIKPIIKDIFGPLPKSVFVANFIEEAKEISESNNIEMVVSDIDISGESGFDLIDWMNKCPEVSGVPVIIITEKSNDIETIKRAKSLKIDKYLVKPFENDHLRNSMIEVSAKKYRRVKMMNFIKHYALINEDEKYEEQKRLSNLNTIIQDTKKRMKTLNKRLRHLPAGKNETPRKAIKEELNFHEEEVKELRENVTEMKKAFAERRKNLLKLKRCIHQRLANT